MTLIYHGRLPPGALVSPPSAAPEPQPPPEPPPQRTSAAIWLSAGSGEVEAMPGAPDRIRRWIDPVSEAEAVAVKPNAAGTLLDRGPRPALVFSARENGGLALAGAIPDARRLSFGVIFEPVSAETETLLTLQPADAEDHLYLAGQSGAIRLGQDRGALDLRQALALTPGRPVLVLCSLDGERVALAVNGGPPVTGRLAAALSGAADLFIGCRGRRAVMKRRLGSFRLSDVFLWSGEGLGGGDAATALDLWRERSHGA